MWLAGEGLYREEQIDSLFFAVAVALVVIRVIYSLMHCYIYQPQGYTRHLMSIARGHRLVFFQIVSQTIVEIMQMKHIVSHDLFIVYWQYTVPSQNFQIFIALSDQNTSILDFKKPLSRQTTAIC